MLRGAKRRFNPKAVSAPASIRRGSRYPRAAKIPAKAERLA
jgi:hypothetical protein